LIAFSLFYHFVVSPTRLEKVVTVKEARENTPVEHNTNKDAFETPKAEGPTLTEQREKAARAFEQAQADFERQVSEDRARAKALRDQENETAEARKGNLLQD